MNTLRGYFTHKHSVFLYRGKEAFLMIIQGGANINAPGAGGVKRTYGAAAGRAKSEKSEFARRFDSVTISGAGENAAIEGIGAALKNELAREIRAAASPENVAALRELVQRGEYRPDAGELAKRMLLLGEDP